LNLIFCAYIENLRVFHVDFPGVFTRSKSKSHFVLNCKLS
jgi:hypothetical protein